MNLKNKIQVQILHLLKDCLINREPISIIIDNNVLKIEDFKELGRFVKLNISGGVFDHYNIKSNGTLDIVLNLSTGLKTINFNSKELMSISNPNGEIIIIVPGTYIQEEEHSAIKDTTNANKKDLPLDFEIKQKQIIKPKWKIVFNDETKIIDIENGNYK